VVHTLWCEIHGFCSAMERYCLQCKRLTCFVCTTNADKVSRSETCFERTPSDVHLRTTCTQAASISPRTSKHGFISTDDSVHVSGWALASRDVKSSEYRSVPEAVYLLVLLSKTNNDPMQPLVAFKPISILFDLAKLAARSLNTLWRRRRSDTACFETSPTSRRTERESLRVSN